MINIAGRNKREEQCWHVPESAVTDVGTITVALAGAMARRHRLCGGSRSHSGGERGSGASRCLGVVVVGSHPEIFGRVAHVGGFGSGTIWVVVLIEGAGVSKWELDSEIVLRMRICDWGETQLEGLGKPGCSRN